MLDRLRNNLEGILLGKKEVIDNALVALLAEGHILIEDVPGVGKTLLAKGLARSLRCSFHRIQFTPDLLPSDLLGTSIFHQPSQEFVFHAGPIFAQVILADEINRATPRTQSALLEAMSEGSVSIDGQTRPLGPPFLVLATQNPFEYEGTYPLPESQLDRFLMRIRIGYPPRSVEKDILAQHRLGEPVDSLEPVCDVAELLALRNKVRLVRFDERLQDYLLEMIDATRKSPQVVLGASTRAALAFFRAAQARAALDNRDFVNPDDIKNLAIPVLAHRLLLKKMRQVDGGAGAEGFLKELLAKIPVPT